MAQVESITMAPGKVEAILRPREGASANELGGLHDALIQKGISNYIGWDKGDMLIIPEVADEKALLSVLTEGKWTSGNPQTIATAADKQIAKDSVAQKIQKNTVFGSAILYNLGNLSQIVSGIQRARHNRDGKWTSNDVSEMMTGIAFTIGDLLLLGYGKDKKDDPLIAFSNALSGHLKQHGVELPKSADAEAIAKSGFFSSVNEFLSHNITPIKCLSEAVGGAFLIKSSLKPGEFNPGKFAAGLLVATGWLATFILDKPHAPPYEFKSTYDPSNASTGERFWHWLNENPRGRIGTPFGMANNVANVYGTLWPLDAPTRKGEMFRFRDDVTNARAGVAKGFLDITEKVKGIDTTRRLTGPELHDHLRYTERKQHDWAFNVVTASAFFAGHALFAKSGDRTSDRAATDNPEFRDDILDVAANVLANVPAKMRDHAIGEAADYITSIKGVTQSREEVIQAIGDHLAHIKTSVFTAPSISAALPAR